MSFSIFIKFSEYIRRPCSLPVSSSLLLSPSFKLLQVSKQTLPREESPFLSRCTLPPLSSCLPASPLQHHHLSSSILLPSMRPLTPSFSLHQPMWSQTSHPLRQRLHSRPSLRWEPSAMSLVSKDATTTAPRNPLGLDPPLRLTRQMLSPKIKIFKYVKAIMFILLARARAAVDAGVQSIAENAPTPDGYASVFTDLDGSLSASNYMGLYTFQSFDTLSCASQCDQASGCQAFNVYMERDPSVNPASACPNPPSTTNFRCTLWGAPVSAGEATNTGQWRDQFQVVITGSNGTSPFDLPNKTILSLQHKKKPRTEDDFNTEEYADIISSSSL